MVDREAAIRSAEKALTLLGERAERSPDYGVYVHAEEQLIKMLEALRAETLPPPADRGWVDIGIMAVRELEAEDPDFANALMDADYDFKHAA